MYGDKKLLDGKPLKGLGKLTDDITDKLRNYNNGKAILICKWWGGKFSQFISIDCVRTIMQAIICALLPLLKEFQQ